MRQQRAPRAFGIALALLAHMALIQGLTHVTRHAPPIAARAPVMPAVPALVWLRLPVIPASPLTIQGSNEPVQAPAARRSRDNRPTAVEPEPLWPANPAPSHPPDPHATDLAGVAAAVPDEPASEPRHEPLLRTTATRQAIRQAAQAPLLSERAAQATGLAPDTQAARLERASAAAGRGDCVKGDYPGAGMGLLSLPFLAAAAVSGQCAR